MYRFRKGRLLKKMQNIDLPVNYISGSSDLVFPIGDFDETSSNFEKSRVAKIKKVVKNKFQFEIIQNGEHNMTQDLDEVFLLAEILEKMLFEIEEIS
jgi:hypothetical protein